MLSDFGIGCQYSLPQIIELTCTINLTVAGEHLLNQTGTWSWHSQNENGCIIIKTKPWITTKEWFTEGIHQSFEEVFILGNIIFKCISFCLISNYKKSKRLRFAWQSRLYRLYWRYLGGNYGKTIEGRYCCIWMNELN